MLTQPGQESRAGYRLSVGSTTSLEPVVVRLEQENQIRISRERLLMRKWIFNALKREYNTIYNTNRCLWVLKEIT